MCLFAVSFACAISSYAASFDCRLAKSPREKAVCASPQLSAQDSALAAEYAALRTQLSPIAFSAVQSDQRGWLSYLDAACPAHPAGDRGTIADCLRGEYTTRLTELKLQRTSTGTVIYTRIRDFISPGSGKPDPDAFPGDPGFGVYHYSWPQADNPDAALTQWNSAVAAYVLTLTADDKHTSPTSLDQTATSDSTVDLDYSFSGGNAHFLLVEFSQYEFSYGAAHGNTRLCEFTWNLDAHRELATSDVFAQSSGWQTKLTPVALRKLRANSDVRSMLLEEELPAGIIEAWKDPRQWTLAPTGLTVRYGQYQVAAYAAGMPSISFTWASLKPYLNPAFRPQDLPTVRKSSF
jgi:uncharacterized protein YecT (DUF1311 family)